MCGLVNDGVYSAGVLNVAAASYPATGGALALLGWRYPFLLPVLAIPVGFWVLFSLRKAEPHNTERIGKHLGLVLGRLKSGRVLGLFACSLTTFVILFGALQSYLPEYVDETFGAGPLLVGVVLASVSITTALTSAQLGRLSGRFSVQTLIRASFLLSAAALCTIPLAPGAP